MPVPHRPQRQPADLHDPRIVQPVRPSFYKYLYAGSHQLPPRAQTPARSRTAGDLQARNHSERDTARVFEKEIEFYRSLETLKEDFVSRYGENFQALFRQIAGAGPIDEANLAAFIYKYRDRVEFSHEEYEALCRRIADRGSSRILYQEFARAFSPFEPVNFPVFRKDNNLREALDYVWKEVRALNIDTREAELPEVLGQTLGQAQKTGFNKTNVSFRRVYDPLRSTNPQGRYIYDKDYFNELKEYKVNYFDPSKDYKFSYQEDPAGPQYHDHFFEDYYQHLHQRNKSEYFYNKFGKRYTFDAR